ncbi:MAG: MmcQ/YjbR family DNA-binding protein [Acidobacteriota bacterium]
MNKEDFRRLALSLPGASEGAHMGHPDFRVGGRIFATLSPEEGWAMVKLTPDEQEAFAQAAPAVFSPVPGGWGRGGATRVQLRAATKAVARDGLVAAWRHRAPKPSVAELESKKTTRASRKKERS